MNDSSSPNPGSSPDPGQSPGPSRSRLPLIAGLGFVGLVVVAVALWALFRGDAPAAVDLDAATSELTDDGSDADTDADADDDSNADESSGAVDVSGNWTVDTSIGEFSFENSTGTYVGFRIGEELTTVGVTEAVGRTPAVSGSITIDGEAVTAVNIEADMTAITTDISRRDGATRRALETDSFPTATFVLTETIEVGIDPASGQPFSGTAVGDLTVHGVTKSVEVAIEAQLVDDVIAIIGSTGVALADYGVTAPSAPVVARIEEAGVIEFQLFLAKS